LNGSSGIAPLKGYDGQLVYSDADKATVLNKLFASVFTIDNGVIDQSKLPDKTTDAMPPVFFTPDKVLKFIKELKPKGSIGPDAIPAEFLKVTGGLIALPLSIIMPPPHRAEALSDAFV